MTKEISETGSNPERLALAFVSVRVRVTSAQTSDECQ
jgi:hypothetical protein